MATAYVDSSAIVAIAFAERGGIEVGHRLDEFTDIRSSNLLEAEVRAAYHRVGEDFDFDVLANINWIFPDRSLATEITRVLEVGYVRGADLWHLASSLYVAADTAEVTFVTLDEQQRRVARALGFRV